MLLSMHCIFSYNLKYSSNFVFSDGNRDSPFLGGFSFALGSTFCEGSSENWSLVNIKSSIHAQAWLFQNSKEQKLGPSSNSTFKAWTCLIKAQPITIWYCIVTVKVDWVAPKCNSNKWFLVIKLIVPIKKNAQRCTYFLILLKVVV